MERAADRVQSAAGDGRSAGFWKIWHWVDMTFPATFPAALAGGRRRAGGRRVLVEHIPPSGIRPPPPPAQPTTVHESHGSLARYCRLPRRTQERSEQRARNPRRPPAPCARAVPVSAAAAAAPEPSLAVVSFSRVAGQAVSSVGS